MLESVFNKVAGLQLSSENCKFLRKAFLYKTPPVAASENFINFLGNISGGGVTDLSFIINTTE